MSQYLVTHNTVPGAGRGSGNIMAGHQPRLWEHTITVHTVYTVHTFYIVHNVHTVHKIRDISGVHANDIQNNYTDCF